MKVTTEPLENRQLLLVIEVDEERIQKAMRRIARRLAKDTIIPGFRKGKAPYDRILYFYGEEVVRREAAEELAQEVYREALEQHKEIEPYAPGELSDLVLKPLTFKFTISLPPVVTLGDYRSFLLRNQTDKRNLRRSFSVDFASRKQFQREEQFGEAHTSHLESPTR